MEVHFKSTTYLPFMRDNAEFTKDVSLLNAKIGSALEMDGSRFRGELLMQRLEVANNLFMRSAKFAKVILNGAKIGGNLELSGSTFNSIDLCRYQYWQSIHA